MRKSIFILISILMLSVLLLSACGGAAAPAPASAPTSPPKPTEKPFLIGLVTDVGEIDDKSFNQSAWEGAQAGAKAVGGTTNYIETQDAKDYMANIGEFVDQGATVIVTVGFGLGQATVEAAKKYPNVKFIGVDQFQAETLPNLAGLIWNEDQAGYLVGILAGSVSKSGTIAGVFGTDLVPPVVKFKEGYEKGAMSVNPKIKVISTYHPGGMDVAFSDPEWAAATTAQAVGQGADVVFGAGGTTGNGALIEAASHKGVFCLGVDSDQWFTVPEAHGCLISSAMKLITPGVSELIQKAKAGSFPSGNYFGVVGIAPFHDFDSAVPADVKKLLEDTALGLKDGKIKTGVGEK